MNIPVTFPQRNRRDRFVVEVRVVSVAVPAPVWFPSAAVAPMRTVPVEQYRDRLIGLLRRCRLRLEQRRLETLRLGL